MEFGVRQFRWHEQFNGIPWNLIGVRQFRWHEQFHGIPWNSMELGVRQFRWHEQFHWIQRNSMEHGVRQLRLTRAVPSNSMEFYGTWSALIWSYCINCVYNDNNAIISIQYFFHIYDLWYDISINRKVYGRDMRHVWSQWPLLLTWFNFNPSMDK